MRRVGIFILSILVAQVVTAIYFTFVFLLFINYHSKTLFNLPTILYLFGIPLHFFLIYRFYVRLSAKFGNQKSQ